MSNKVATPYKRRGAPPASYTGQGPGWYSVELDRISQNIPGTVVATLDPYDIIPGEDGVVDQNFVRGDVRRYGAPWNGTDDDAPAIMQAFANVQTGGAPAIILPPGTGRPLSNLDFVIADDLTATTRQVTIMGYGVNTRLKPGPLVTEAVILSGGLSEDLTHRMVLRDLQIDMNDTTSAKGIVVGGITTGQSIVSGVGVWRATGANAAGVYVKDAVISTLTNLTVGRCENGIHIEGSTPDFPTMVTVQDSWFYLNDNWGMNLVRGNSIIARNVTVEASGDSGVYCASTDVADNVDIVFDHCWFEGNCRTTGTYDLFFDAEDAGTVNLGLVNKTRFNEATKALYMRRVANYWITDLNQNNVAASIRIETGSAPSEGTFGAWNNNRGAFATVVSIDAGSLATTYGPIT